MANRIAFLVRLTRIILALVAALCLVAPVEAQHGGGGGHTAGGHFGGGHSSGGHTGGARTGGWHSSWLHLGSGNRAARHAGRLGTLGPPGCIAPPAARPGEGRNAGSLRILDILSAGPAEPSLVSGFVPTPFCRERLFLFFSVSTPSWFFLRALSVYSRIGLLLQRRDPGLFLRTSVVAVFLLIWF